MPELYSDRCGNSRNTPTVGDLIRTLSRFEPDMPVAYTWEGQILPVDLGKIVTEEGNPHLAATTLLLDADTL